MTPATIAPIPVIDALRATFIKAQDTAAQLGDKAQQYNKRLPEIATELAIAMADGNGTHSAQLRAERAAIEAELRDIEGASVIAHQRVSFADTALAREELSKLFPEVAADYAAFVAGVDALHKLSARMKARANFYTGRYTIANLPDKETNPRHPGYAMRLGHVAGFIEKYLRDVTGNITADV